MHVHTATCACCCRFACHMGLPAPDCPSTHCVDPGGPLGVAVEPPVPGPAQFAGFCTEGVPHNAVPSSTSDGLLGPCPNVAPSGGPQEPVSVLAPHWLGCAVSLGGWTAPHELPVASLVMTFGVPAHELWSPGLFHCGWALCGSLFDSQMAVPLLLFHILLGGALTAAAGLTAAGLGGAGAGFMTFSGIFLLGFGEVVSMSQCVSCLTGLWPQPSWLSMAVVIRSVSTDWRFLLAAVAFVFVLEGFVLRPFPAAWAQVVWDRGGLWLCPEAWDAIVPGHCGEDSALDGVIWVPHWPPVEVGLPHSLLVVGFPAGHPSVEGLVDKFAVPHSLDPDCCNWLLPLFPLPASSPAVEPTDPQEPAPLWNALCPDMALLIFGPVWETDIWGPFGWAPLLGMVPCIRLPLPLPILLANDWGTCTRLCGLFPPKFGCCPWGRGPGDPPPHPSLDEELSGLEVSLPPAMLVTPCIFGTWLLLERLGLLLLQPTELAADVVIPKSHELDSRPLKLLLTLELHKLEEFGGCMALDPELLLSWLWPKLLDPDITDSDLTEALSVSDAVSEWSPPMEGHASLSFLSTIILWDVGTFCCQFVLASPRAVFCQSNKLWLDAADDGAPAKKSRHLMNK